MFTDVQYLSKIITSPLKTYLQHIIRTLFYSIVINYLFKVDCYLHLLFWNIMTSQYVTVLLDMSKTVLTLTLKPKQTFETPSSQSDVL